MDLTKKQQAILDYIGEYMQDHGYAPSVREIASNFNLASPTGAHRYLKVLEKKGYISSDAQVSRSIRLLHPGSGQPASERQVDSSTVELPLRGRVAAGVPIQYQVDNESMSFPVSMVRFPEKSYVLEVQGESMIDEAILDGDFVIVEQRETADNGDLVIAMLPDEEATLKRLFKEGNQIRLQPANAAMEPIYVNAEEVSVQGIVKAVFRKY